MDLKVFFDAVRETAFGGSLSSQQVEGCEALLSAFALNRWPLAWAAYGLATAKWETDHTMQPIAEYGRGKGRRYGVAGRHGQAQYGRGYVQLTWDKNYERADRELGLNGRLIANFDLALVPEIAAAIMVRGMSEGWFTGRKCSDYLNKSPPDFVGARRIINGTDRAAAIAAIAATFAIALRVAGYSPIPPSKPAPAPTPAPKPTTPQPASPAAPAGFWTRFRAALQKRIVG